MPRTDEEDFGWGDMDRFMNEHFKPFLERFDRHLDADDKRFDAMTSAVQRISTGIEVSAAVQQAQVAQTDRIFRSWWTRAAVGSTLLSPMVALAVALWRH